MMHQRVRKIQATCTKLTVSNCDMPTNLKIH